jgi:hypothetical protein
VGQVELIRILPQQHTRRARQLKHAVEFLADDDAEVSAESVMGGPVVLPRDLQHDPRSKAERVSLRLRDERPLGADLERPAKVLGPAAADERHVLGHAAELRVACDEYGIPHVAPDAHDAPRPEQFDVAADADGGGQRDVADVGQPLFLVVVRPVQAERPPLRRQHFARRHKPEARVTVNRRQHGPRFRCGVLRAGCGLGSGTLRLCSHRRHGERREYQPAGQSTH